MARRKPTKTEPKRHMDILKTALVLAGLLLVLIAIPIENEKQSLEEQTEEVNYSQVELMLYIEPEPSEAPSTDK